MSSSLSSSSLFVALTNSVTISLFRCSSSSDMRGSPQQVRSVGGGERSVAGTRRWQELELAHHGEHVPGAVSLHELPVGEAEEVHPQDVHPLSCRRDTEEAALMRSGPAAQRANLIAFRNHVKDVVLQ